MVLNNNGASTHPTEIVVQPQNGFETPAQQFDLTSIARDAVATGEPWDMAQMVETAVVAEAARITERETAKVAQEKLRVAEQMTELEITRSTLDVFVADEGNPSQAAEALTTSAKTLLAEEQKLATARENVSNLNPRKSEREDSLIATPELTALLEGALIDLKFNPTDADSTEKKTWPFGSTTTTFKMENTTNPQKIIQIDKVSTTQAKMPRRLALINNRLQDKAAESGVAFVDDSLTGFNEQLVEAHRRITELVKKHPTLKDEILVGEQRSVGTTEPDNNGIKRVLDDSFIAWKLLEGALAGRIPHELVDNRTPATEALNQVRQTVSAAKAALRVEISNDTRNSHANASVAYTEDITKYTALSQTDTTNIDSSPQTVDALIGIIHENAAEMNRSLTDQLNVANSELDELSDPRTVPARINRSLEAAFPDLRYANGVFADEAKSRLSNSAKEILTNKALTAAIQANQATMAKGLLKRPGATTNGWEEVGDQAVENRGVRNLIKIFRVNPETTSQALVELAKENVKALISNNQLSIFAASMLRPDVRDFLSTPYLNVSPVGGPLGLDRFNGDRTIDRENERPRQTAFLAAKQKIDRAIDDRTIDRIPLDQREAYAKIIFAQAAANISQKGFSYPNEYSGALTDSVLKAFKIFNIRNLFTTEEIASAQEGSMIDGIAWTLDLRKPQR